MIGDHGMAVMPARGDLAMEADISSDTAALDGLMEVLLHAAPSTGCCATPPVAAWVRSATSWPGLPR
jgi:hydrogenase maturation factor